jgi:hypothetical protein
MVTAGSACRSSEEKSRRALTGGMAENAGVTWERVDAEDGVLRACPSVDRSATPRLLDIGFDGHGFHGHGFHGHGFDGLDVTGEGPAG